MVSLIIVLFGTYFLGFFHHNPQLFNVGFDHLVLQFWRKKQFEKTSKLKCTKAKINFISIVGVVVGGGEKSFQQCEVFVPGQVCQKKLPDLPIRVALPIVVILNGLLVVCGKQISVTVRY